MLHVHVMSCKFLMALKNMVAFSIAWEKCAEPLSCNFQQKVFVGQGGKRPGDSAENQETVFVLKPVSTGLLNKVASNKSFSLDYFWFYEE